MAFPMTSSLAKRSRRLIEVWLTLVDDARAEILSLAVLRPYDVDDLDAVAANTHGNGEL